MMKDYLKIFVGFLFVLVTLSCQKTNGLTNVDLTVRQPVLPILAKKEQNRVLDILLIVKDSLAAHNTSSFSFSLDGRNNDIDKASLLYSETGKFEDAQVLSTQAVKKTDFDFAVNHPIFSGKNVFWLSVKLKALPDLSRTIQATLKSITFDDESKIETINLTKTSQRIGIALRQINDDNVNTYRIPGLATTNKGTLLGVYDVRYNDPVDLQENIDVGLSRSTDGGETWEPMKIIMDMGEYGGKGEDENGIGDPAILVDKNTNTIWVTGLWFHGKPGQRAWNASAPGMKPKETGQLMLVKSEDDGLTWSKPINITEQTKKPEWQLFFNGPGAGIAMKDGTLVFAAQFKDKDRIPHATIIYSKDGGTTWQVGTAAKSETTEAQVVELSDGSLMLNMRDDRNRAERKDSLNGRSIAISNDLGQTWNKHITSRKSLQASNCMASIISFDHPEKGKVLFFSNPDTKVGRGHVTIKTSFDEGLTWPKENQLELYEDDTYGYSCLSVIDNTYLGVLYEGNRELFFQKIPISELIKN